MYIRKAIPSEAVDVVPLIRLAIQDIAEALTGEVEEKRILAVLTDFFKQASNRLSYENCFVCDIDGRIVGTILVYYGAHAEELDLPLLNRLRKVRNDLTLKIEKEADAGDFYIDTLAVNQSFRKQGIGTALIQFAEQYAVKKGYTRMSLAVEGSNLKAQSLYKKMGYHFKNWITLHHHQYEYRVKLLNESQA